MYNLRSLSGSENMKVTRSGKDSLEFEIDGKKVKVFTEDLAALIQQELPDDRAAEMFSEIEDKMISKGKAWIKLEAKKDIKKGEPIVSQIDIAKYLDAQGRPAGIRTTNFGFLY